jgi:hypothetical protein
VKPKDRVLSASPCKCAAECFRNRPREGGGRDLGEVGLKRIRIGKKSAAIPWLVS